ncbi:hypothetical protein D3C78_1105400 [compost metagenome]
MKKIIQKLEKFLGNEDGITRFFHSNQYLYDDGGHDDAIFIAPSTNAGTLQASFMTDLEKISDILKRRDYFDSNFPVIEGCNSRQDIPYRLSNSCPSCGYLALDARCRWEICMFCFWEDDGQDNHDADKVWGGPNGDYSLTAHRLEVFDWMNDLKDNKTTNDPVEKLIGIELSKLDSYISENELNRQLVLNQIELISRRFNLSRDINSNDKPTWKFLTEKQMTKIKPAYNSSLPKARQTWWQKFLGFE